LAAAICQAGIAALPTGAPVPNGVELRLCSEATASVVVPLLTEAGLAVVASAEELPLVMGDETTGEDEPMPDGRP